MFIGGVLIRRFDGFRRLCQHAAAEFHLPLSMPSEDLLLANRALAALGGPPAASQVQGSFNGDGLPLLLLFLLTQEYPCQIGLAGESEPVLGRLKSLTHLLGHAVWPMLRGEPQPLSFQEVVRELGPTGAELRPLFQYDSDGEPTFIAPSGAVAHLRTPPGSGPCHLAVLLSESARPVPLVQPAGDLHPAVLTVKP